MFMVGLNHYKVPLIRFMFLIVLFDESLLC